MAHAQLKEAEAAEKAFETALDGGLRQLRDALLPRIRPRLDAFGNTSYTLQTEAAFAAAEGDTFVGGLVGEMELTLAPLAPTLASGARERLVHLLLQASAERLEAIILTKRFDQLGALLLDAPFGLLLQLFKTLAGLGHGLVICCYFCFQLSDLLS